jgi:hypothetical protein
MRDEACSVARHFERTLNILIFALNRIMRSVAAARASSSMQNVASERTGKKLRYAMPARARREAVMHDDDGGSHAKFEKTDVCSVF